MQRQINDLLSKLKKANAKGDKLDAVKSAFQCTIGFHLMRNPVVAADNQMYVLRSF